MAIHRTRKNKENPHYGFLVSWQPAEPHVKGESKIESKAISFEAKGPKKADILAQAETGRFIKKDILKSLILVSLILILELVVYFAWSRFMS